MPWNDENISPSITNSEDASLAALGQNGFVYVGDTTATTGNFAAIQVLSDCIFSSLTALNSTVGGLVGLVISAGTIIYGPFTAFTLSSGKVIAYKA